MSTGGMTSGWLFLGIGLLLAVVDLTIAHFFARSIGRRRDVPPMLDGQQTSPLAGVRMLRVGAIGIFLIMAAFAFGVIHVDYIQPIKLPLGATTP